MRYIILLFSILGYCASYCQNATTVLAEPMLMLMHENRVGPSPRNGEVIPENPPALMWPDKFIIPQSVLDGDEVEHVQRQITYKVRLSDNKHFRGDVVEAVLPWAFYNIGKPLDAGDWYWQYCYVSEGKEEWSPVIKFTVTDKATVFSRPTYGMFIENLPKDHPRILIQKSRWDDFIARNADAPEKKLFIKKAEDVLRKPMKTLDDANLSRLADPRFKNKTMRDAYITRESRKIVDSEEINIDALTRAYLLTKERRYATEAINRILEMISWKGHKYLIGDFNASTLLSVASMAYDSFYDILSEREKQMLFTEIKTGCKTFFEEYVNSLENHIANNHVVQMTLRILSFATVSIYGQTPEADKWLNYCYNLWCARFPGITRDGGWHNGDTYFSVNMRTLIELPFFYQTITGFDFFRDSWYDGSAMYTVYHQPPFSKSAGNGSSHANRLSTEGNRVGYADALARLKNNSILADYVRRMLKGNPEVLKKAFLGKPDDLTWFRLQCGIPLPQGPGLESLRSGYVFPQAGLATFHSDWSDHTKNAMFAMRSSPFGSTSHALANQNAFNTFYGGKSLFYSSGHHVSFTDSHSFYCHRATRAHNTILVNGMGQKIGTEGYGWIPRFYIGDRISYVVADASNAYGETTSELWLRRAKLSNLEYTPRNGWDKNRLKTFRRHIVQLGDAGLVFIYDELEAHEPVTFDYLLHSVINPLETEQRSERMIRISATNDHGRSDAFLCSASRLGSSMTDQFLYPAVNWLRSDAQGNYKPYPNHWHFTATSPKVDKMRFVTFVSTHALDEPALEPTETEPGVYLIGDWVVRANIDGDKQPWFSVENKKRDVRVVYNQCTVIKENGNKTLLKDQVPQLDI